jgi:Ring hydroxylating alpha subunit (catalytic domain)/FAD dependent oxidoreductase
VPAFGHGGADLDWDAGIPHRDGAWTFTATGTSDRAPFDGLDEAERTRHKGELVYPNLMLSLSADHAAAFTLLFTLWPTAAGHTRIACDLLFAPAEVAKATFDPSDASGFWDVVNRQDWAVCESVQRGMSSRGFTQGWFAPMEDFSLDIRQDFGPHRLPVWIWMDDPSFYGFPTYAEGGHGALVKAAQDCGGAPTTAYDRSFDPDPTALDRLRHFVTGLLPGVGAAHHTATCLYTLTPDRDFVVDTLPDHPAVCLGLGAGHGFKFAPTFGRLLADLATTGTTTSDIAAFAMNRPALVDRDYRANWLV